MNLRLYGIQEALGAYVRQPRKLHGTAVLGGFASTVIASLKSDPSTEAVSAAGVSLNAHVGSNGLRLRPACSLLFLVIALPFRSAFNSIYLSRYAINVLGELIADPVAHGIQNEV